MSKRPFAGRRFEVQRQSSYRSLLVFAFLKAEPRNRLSMLFHFAGLSENDPVLRPSPAFALPGAFRPVGVLLQSCDRLLGCRHSAGSCSSTGDFASSEIGSGRFPPLSEGTATPRPWCRAPGTSRQ